MRLVYLSPVPWNSFAQRPHKFVQWFHDRTGEGVLWVEPYPTRFPQLGDFKRLVGPPAQTARLIETPPWLTVVKPSALPIEPLLGSAVLNRQLWRDVLKRVEVLLRETTICIAVGKPSLLARELLRRFPGNPSLYDAMDDFPAFYKGISRTAFARRELQVVHRVDAVWTSSSRLREHWSRRHANVQLVFNALDLAVVPKPIVLQLSRRHSARAKVFGYVGTIAAWFDWDWIKALAQARPEDEIRLIGPVYEAPTAALPANIRMLPACHHADALKAMADFDVGLIPFKKNTLTSSVDPIKYYEYRALALPILSTDFGEMHGRFDAPGVFISQSSNDVALLAEQAVQLELDPHQAREFALHNTWEQRFDSAGFL